MDAYYLNRILKGAKPGDLPVEGDQRGTSWCSVARLRMHLISIAPSIALRAGQDHRLESIPMKVLIVDDHALIKDALGRVISLVPDAAVLEAGGGGLPFRR